MKRNTVIKPRRLFLLLMIWTLLAGLMLGSAAFTASAAAEETVSSPLTPDDISYENGNIILHKHGERIGPDEWKVTVKATIGEVPVEKRKMEVVFVLDASGSMAWCTDEKAHGNGNHTHTKKCSLLNSCELEEHEHKQEECYEKLCEFTQEHTHKEDCKEYNCGLEAHTHIFVDKDDTSDCYGGKCTQRNNPKHWSGGTHKAGYSCYNFWGTYYQLTCKVAEHDHAASNCTFKLKCGSQEHTHSSKCYGDLICDKQEHIHKDTCRIYSCGEVERWHSTTGGTACTYEDVNGKTVNYKTRLQAAKETIASMVSNLTKDGDNNVIFKYVIFSSSGYDNGVGKSSSTKVVDSFNSVTAKGGTYMYTGIETGINQFSNNDYKKVLVVLTDGKADDYANSAPSLSNFKSQGTNGKNGTVFTVGFAYSNDTLAGIAGNGGSYVHAGSDVELNQAMQGIEISLTAMLEDPMGTTVGFEKTSIQEVQTSGGSITSNDDTIYWHPAEDGIDTVRNSTIEYSYTVQLNDKADLSGGVHSDVPLNNPTNFLYGIKENGTTNMESAAFPIPKATYAISSVQTKWQANGRDIKAPTEIESIICDYASATYIPAFEQDYQTITPVIPIEGSNDYYRYVGTTVTANGTSLPGVEAVDATEPKAYVVIHQYERVHANELVISGTKTLIGRDFQPGDSFSFTLTAVSPANAPMPAQGFETKTITPESGTSMAFSFNQISFNAAGTYTYTIQEQRGDLDNVIYDTTEHRLVVKAQNVNNQIVISYTMDGVENGHLMITNSLKTGSLEIKKNRVTSHLDEHQNKPFNFLVSIRDVSNRPLSGEYQLKTGSSITFTNGYAALALKARESAEILGLPDGASYTVTEDAVDGFTATSSGATGVIKADQKSTASFDNTYQSNGLYQFIGRKTLEGADLALDQFSFSVLDEEREVVARGKNNADGTLFLDTLHFTQDDIGTKTYTIVEDKGADASILYDSTEHKVTLTIADKRDGTLSVTDNLNGKMITFTNKHITGQFVVSKTVSGNLGSKNKEFPFTLTLPEMASKKVSVSTDGGSTFTEMTLNAQGTTTFTLRDSQSIIFFPVSGRYTVTETDAGGYTTTYSINQGNPTTGTTASGTLDASGGHIAFVNTLEATVPTGVDTPTASAFMCLCLAFAMMAISLAGRRLMRDEE